MLGLLLSEGFYSSSVVLHEKRTTLAYMIFLFTVLVNQSHTWKDKCVVIVKCRNATGPWRDFTFDPQILSHSFEEPQMLSLVISRP